MFALRQIPLSLHGAIELLVGVLLLVAPFALGFSPAGFVVAGLVGACAVGLAFDATAPNAVAAHQGFDAGLALGAGLAALPLALAGDAAAALALGAAGLVEAALIAGTRYSDRG